MDDCRISRINVTRTPDGFVWEVDVLGLRSDRVAELVSALDASVANLQAAEASWADPIWRDGFFRGVAASIKQMPCSEQ